MINIYKALIHNLNKNVSLCFSSIYFFQLFMHFDIEIIGFTDRSRAMTMEWFYTPVCMHLNKTKIQVAHADSEETNIFT